MAVKQLANNRASGPDRLPNEFVKVYWGELKHEIYRMMLRFSEGTLELSNYNEANIIMIPKLKHQGPHPTFALSVC